MFEPLFVRIILMCYVWSSALFLIFPFLCFRWASGAFGSLILVIFFCFAFRQYKSWNIDLKSNKFPLQLSTINWKCIIYIIKRIINTLYHWFTSSLLYIYTKNVADVCVLVCLITFTVKYFSDIQSIIHCNEVVTVFWLQHTLSLGE